MNERTNTTAPLHALHASQGYHASNPLFFDMDKTSKTHLGALLLCLLCAPFAVRAEIVDPPHDVSDRVSFYREHYDLDTPSETLVDGHGNGFQGLYGVRNFRMVLPGALYVGGANNYYHRQERRANRNPLLNSALSNLCNEGFSEAIYLYSTNFRSARKLTKCGSNQLHYQTMRYQKDLKRILETIYNSFQDGEGPVYVHCWNGRHAAGFIAAAALRQFCGTSVRGALRLWKTIAKEERGNGYPHVRRAIRRFTPYQDYTISKSLQEKICPGAH